jgi:heptaprenyl diphosphate synthase
VLLLRKSAAAGDAEAVSLLALIDGGLDDDTKLQEALSRLRDHPVADEAYQEAKRWADEAVTSISSLPNGPIKNALELFAQAVVERTN